MPPVNEAELMDALEGLGLPALGVSATQVATFCIEKDVAPAHLGEAALVVACGARSAAALAEFERRYAAEFVGALSRVRLDRAAIDEISQRVREKLFVGDASSPPRILNYAGRGALVSFLRAVIVRTAIDVRRHEKLEPAPTDDAEPLLRVAQATDDPELENIRARYAGPFRDAIRDAVRSLDADERNALRLHVTEGLTLDEVARIYGVHRATAARWIQSARDQILLRTKRLLSERLRLSPPEFDSLVRLCRSRLELTFSGTDAAP